MNKRITLILASLVLVGCGSDSSSSPEPHCSDVNRIDASGNTHLFRVNECNDVTSYRIKYDYYHQVGAAGDSLTFSDTTGTLKPYYIVKRGNWYHWTIQYSNNSLCFTETYQKSYEDDREVNHYCDDHMYYHQIMSEYDYGHWADQVDIARKNAKYF
ncbi:hypothetical protein [Vibrio agarivorans]|uniref:hypothetical protein n=1 Tax=Vibrio agarivorans TaxID=153622 RepID=UPI00222F2F64|nr:hypothetical protein [Vibrio agarivorans]MDN3659945.1 hypothetical protein [Vibrio agarivorans]